MSVHIYHSIRDNDKNIVTCFSIRFPIPVLVLLDAFQRDNGREPTEGELAALLGMTPERIIGLTVLDPRGVSLDSPVGEDSSDRLVDLIPDTSTGETDGALVSESLRSDLESVLSVLNERERQVVRLSFGIGDAVMTLEEISAALGLTRERVRQLRVKALHKLSSPHVRARLAQYL